MRLTPLTLPCATHSKCTDIQGCFIVGILYEREHTSPDLSFSVHLSMPLFFPHSLAVPVGFLGKSYAGYSNLTLK